MLYGVYLFLEKRRKWMKKILLVAAMFLSLLGQAPLANGEEFNFDVDALQTMKIKATPRPPQQPPLPTDEELCREAGLFWSDRLEECFGDEISICQAEGGEWDTRQNICLSTIEAIRCFES
jgi:hypothetical protein